MSLLLALILPFMGSPLPDADQTLGHPIVYLEEIDFSHLNLIKRGVGEGGYKFVYHTQPKDYYIKIWNANRPCSKPLLQACKAGFFDEIAPLVAIVMDREGECRGYITKGMRFTPKTYVLETAPGKRLAPLRKQPPSLKKLVNTLCERAETTGFIHTDLTYYNIVFDGERYYIIDLDAVISRDDYRKKKQKGKAKWFTPKEYFKHF